MTAEEAKSLQVYKKYFDMIKNEAVKGGNSITIYDRIDVSIFTDLGYTVNDWTSQRDGYQYEICW